MDNTPFTVQDYELIKANLKRGDKSEIASQFGVNKSYVTRVLDYNDGAAYNEEIIDACLERALENREAFDDAAMSKNLRIEQLKELSLIA